MPAKKKHITVEKQKDAEVELFKLKKHLTKNFPEALDEFEEQQSNEAMENVIIHT